MSWSFPKYSLAVGKVVDERDFRLVFSPLVYSSSRMNETNFSEALRTQWVPDNFEPGVAWKAQTTGYTPVVLNGLGEESLVMPDFFAETPGCPYVPWSEGWTPVDSLTQSLRTEEGYVWMSASMQVYLQLAAYYAGWADHNIDTQHRAPEILFALRIDGAVVAETATGGLDSGAEGPKGERGLNGHSFGVDLEALVAVSPGEHLIEVVARASIGDGIGKDAKGDMPLSSARNTYYVAQRECTYMEVAR